MVAPSIHEADALGTLRMPAEQAGVFVTFAVQSCAPASCLAPFRMCRGGGLLVFIVTMSLVIRQPVSGLDSLLQYQ